MYTNIHPRDCSLFGGTEGGLEGEKVGGKGGGARTIDTVVLHIFFLNGVML